MALPQPVELGCSTCGSRVATCLCDDMAPWLSSLGGIRLARAGGVVDLCRRPSVGCVLTRWAWWQTGSAARVSQSAPQVLRDRRDGGPRVCGWVGRHAHADGNLQTPFARRGAGRRVFRVVDAVKPRGRRGAAHQEHPGGRDVCVRDRDGGAFVSGRLWNLRSADFP